MLKNNNTNRERVLSLLARLVLVLLWLVVGLLIVGALVLVVYFWAVVLGFGVCCALGLGVVYFIVLLFSG